MTPILAHNPTGILSAAAIVLLLIPLSYAGISLLGFMLGNIGSERGYIRAGLSALFCSLLIFLVIAPAGIWLQISYGGSDSMEQTDWLSWCQSLLHILAVLTPVFVGRLFTRLSWLRVILITLGITLAMGCILGLLFGLGIIMAVISQG